MSGSPITTYGRRLCGIKFGSATLYIHFYVCDVKEPIVSVVRLLHQGCHVTLSNDGNILYTPDGTPVDIVRRGALLYLQGEAVPYDPEDFYSRCKHFHAVNCVNAIAYHADSWELSGNTSIRHHKRGRRTFYLLQMVRRTFLLTQVNFRT